MISVSLSDVIDHAINSMTPHTLLAANGGGTSEINWVDNVTRISLLKLESLPAFAVAWGHQGWIQFRTGPCFLSY